MPIYDIVCGKCNYSEEKFFQKYDGLLSYICPICGGLEWFKRPVRGNFFIGKHGIQKEAASEVAEMGYGKPM